MCEPVSTGTMFAMQAGSAALGTVSQYAGARQQAAAKRAQVSAANRYAQEQYGRRVANQNVEYGNALNRYSLQLGNYRDQRAFNQEAANRAYAANDLRMQEEFEEAMFSRENRLIKQLQSTGSLAARGIRGNSAQAFDRQSLAQFGRANALEAYNLSRSAYGYQIDNENTALQLRSANNRAYSQVAVAPRPPEPLQAPLMQAMPSSGPSGFELAMGLGGDLLGAYTKTQSLAAPPATTGSPLPSVPNFGDAMNMDLGLPQFNFQQYMP